MISQPLVDREFLLEKFPGKGGWTYALIPDLALQKSNPFGWVRIYGSVDNYELNNYKLMPYGGGKLFLPIKAEIRKSIKKEVGDKVWIIINSEESNYNTPTELMECLKLEPPNALKYYLSLTYNEQVDYINWIYNTRDEHCREKRIIQFIGRLSNGKKFR